MDFMSAYLAGWSVLSLMCLIIGLGLMIAEMFTPGLGLMGMFGIIALIAQRRHYYHGAKAKRQCRNRRQAVRCCYERRIYTKGYPHNRGTHRRAENTGQKGGGRKGIK